MMLMTFAMYMHNTRTFVITNITRMYLYLFGIRIPNCFNISQFLIACKQIISHHSPALNTPYNVQLIGLLHVVQATHTSIFIGILGEYPSLLRYCFPLTGTCCASTSWASASG